MPRTDAAVVVVFKSRDQLSKALDRIARKSDTTSNRVRKSLEKINKAAKRTGSIMGGMLGSMAISQGLFLMSMGVRKVTEEFVGMDQALTSAGAKFPKLIAKGTKDFEKLEAAARKVGGATEFTSKAAAEGLSFLAMAGFTAKQSISALPTIVDLATSANTDLARATDIASDALGAFNLRSEDPATLTKNLARITDVFAATTTSANVTLENLFETMKDGGQVMTGTGQTLETFAAMTGLMGNAGIKGSKAGTTLKNIMLRLAAPTGKAAAMIDEMRLKVADSNGDMRDMVDILEDLEKATEGMGTQQKSAAFDVILGKRAIAGANVIMMQGVRSLREYREALKKAEGASAKMADMMRKGLGVRLMVLKSSLIELGMKVLETFQEQFPNALDDTISAIQNFDPSAMIQAIKDMIDFGKQAYQFFLDWKPLIIALGGAFFALKISLAAATTATALYNLVLAMNPVFAVIMAIGALVAVLWFYSDEIKAWALKVDEIFTGMNDEIDLAVKNIGVTMYNGLAKAWNWVLDLFIESADSILSILGSMSSALGIDLDLSDATDSLKLLSKSANADLKTKHTFDEVRQERQARMGRPQTTLAESQGRTRGAFRRPSSAINPETLGSAPEQNTSIDVSLDFKNLAEDFGQQVSIAATSSSSNGQTDTRVNKKRAGTN